MKKVLLAIFLLLDTVILAATAYFLYAYIPERRSIVLLQEIPILRPLLPAMSSPATQYPPASGTSAPVSSGTIVTVSTSAAAAPAVAPRPPVNAITPNPAFRNIAFSYKNPKAKQVLIRADFTGWKGVPMKRDGNGVWSYSAQLTPGEYAYCFTVDDKIIKDPYNKRTKQIAQTRVSAILVAPAK